jgi:hypothetical protein
MDQETMKFWPVVAAIEILCILIMYSDCKPLELVSLDGFEKRLDGRWGIFGIVSPTLFNVFICMQPMTICASISAGLCHGFSSARVLQAQYL